jgi:hypothetical protein
VSGGGGDIGGGELAMFGVDVALMCQTKFNSY